MSHFVSVVTQVQLGVSRQTRGLHNLLQADGVAADAPLLYKKIGVVVFS